MTNVQPRLGPGPVMIDQILSGAEQAFLAIGYDLATMDAVARHAGVARASVYNHFKSKEELFLAVMQRGIAAFVDRAVGGDDPVLLALDRLRIVAVTFLNAAVEPAAVEMYRIVLAHGGRFPELSATLYAEGLLKIEQKFHAIARLVDRAIIPDADVFAELLLGQLMGAYFGRRLLGIAGRATDGSPEDYVERSIGALLRR